VLTQVCPGLVEAVEAGRLETPETEALLRQCLTPLIEAGVDQLVLGCTHYPFLRPTIERVVKAGVAVIDPAPAVARQTGRVLARQGPTGNRPGGSGQRQDRLGHHVFYTSGDVTAFAATFTQLIPSSGEDVDVRATRWQDGRLNALK
jgi:glutamate racemase